MTKDSIDIYLSVQGTFYVTVHATTEDQKDQRYMLPASPHEKVPSLLDKAVKKFNRNLGRDQAEVDKYILKVCVFVYGRVSDAVYSMHVSACITYMCNSSVCVPFCPGVWF